MSNPRATRNGGPERSYFDQQRDILLNEISINMESVLANINKLNRSLESIISVGNEFGQVEGLWSQFENMMAKPEDSPGNETNDASAENEAQ